MTKHTSRDDVWDHALRLALDEESFKLQRVRDAASEELSDRTIRDTLNTMADKGWLSKQTPQAHEWNPGPRCCGEEPETPTDATRIEPGPTLNLESGVEYIGKVDRVSNSGNVLITTGDSKTDFINIGPATGCTSGEEVTFEYISGRKGKCTDDEYIHEDYAVIGTESSSSNRLTRGSSSRPDGYSDTSGHDPNTGPSDPSNKNKLLNGHL